MRSHACSVEAHLQASACSTRAEARTYDPNASDWYEAKPTMVLLLARSASRVALDIHE